jgi:hypothetical protein
MIRSVIMVSTQAGTTDEQVTAFLEALAAVPFERRRAFQAGRDLGLGSDTADLVTISDFDDADAYRDWVADPAHRHVAEVYLRPIAERVTRVQFAL